MFCLNNKKNLKIHLSSLIWWVWPNIIMSMLDRHSSDHREIRTDPSRHRDQSVTAPDVQVQNPNTRTHTHTYWSWAGWALWDTRTPPSVASALWTWRSLPGAYQRSPWSPQHSFPHPWGREQTEKERKYERERERLRRTGRRDRGKERDINIETD